MRKSAYREKCNRQRELKQAESRNRGHMKIMALIQRGIGK